MRKLLAVVAAIVLLSLPATPCAHRLDEYLQATLLSVDSGHVEGSIRLVPGVAVFSAVIASIDTNGDGTLSLAEQRAYAQRVLRDVTLRIDGQRLPLRLVSASFPALEEMKQGIGQIQLDFTADLPPGGARRRLVFENHHQSLIAAYLVNCLVPRDRNVRITAQSRNENQSFYQLDFEQGGGGAQQTFLPSRGNLNNPSRLGSPGGLGSPSSLNSPSSLGSFSALTGLGRLSDLASLSGLNSLGGLTGAYRLGVRHIAEGTDHLLFLLALLLPAPLLACGRRWCQGATVRGSLVQILRIVTAFTLGHSLTLALAAFGLVSLPSRPVEVLIAVSILISALHALRPLFPGREPLVAGFFGLIHGLAFATALSDLGLDQGYRLVSILGFNLGIEAMQLAAVAVTLPSLLLMSRTPAYTLLRIGGALFAALASLGWIVERLLNVQTPVSRSVEATARHALWIATGLFILSLLCWLSREFLSRPRAAPESRSGSIPEYV
jgi:hypothetical protein